MDKIKTTRLILRRYAASDLLDFLAWNDHPATMKFMGKPPMTLEQADEYLAEQALLTENETGRWHGYAVEHAGKVIGEVGFYLQKEPADEADLGFAFHPDFHGKGYAAESARALISYGFEVLGLRRITSNCDAANVPSYRLMERLGMERVDHACSESSLSYELLSEAQ